MPAVAVIGAQFGDEGKGKIVDYIAWKYNIAAVVRFNGGSGAGHEVVIDNRKFSFHQLPSGVFMGKKLYIGEGCVVDPELLFKEEIDRLNTENIKPDLHISDNAKVVFDFLREIDAAEENFRNSHTSKQVGSTKRGIGPTYGFDVARFGLRMYDLVDEEKLRRKLPALIRLCQGYLKSLGSNYLIDVAKTVEKYLEFGKKMKPFVKDVRREVNDIHNNGRVLFEGAQGTFLDQIFGTYPYVTSSRTIADGVYGGTGLRIDKAMGERIGVFKAYTSRVGAGPFITRMDDGMQKIVRDKGDEFGRSTGRPRAIGWPNLVELKYANERNSFTGLAMTRLDTFAGVDPIKVCVKYRDEHGNETDEVAADVERYEKNKPVYVELKGWGELEKDGWARIAERGYEALPKEAKSYVKFVEDYVKVPVKIISVGADRKSTIETARLNI